MNESRRSALRQIVESKPDAKDITYPEIKKVLDESWQEEDRMVTGSLTSEKAEEYKKTAEPFRMMIELAAKTAFPAETKDQ